DDHARAGHNIALAAAVDIGIEPGVSVDGIADIDRHTTHPERIDAQLSMLKTLAAGSAVGHAHRQYVFGAKRLGAEKGRQRRVHAARQPNHHLLEAAPPADFVAQKSYQPAPHGLGVDPQKIGVGIELRRRHDSEAGGQGDRETGRRSSLLLVSSSLYLLVWPGLVPRSRRRLAALRAG